MACGYYQTVVDWIYVLDFIVHHDQKQNSSRLRRQLNKQARGTVFFLLTFLFLPLFSHKLQASCSIFSICFFFSSSFCFQSLHVHCPSIPSARTTVSQALSVCSNNCVEWGTHLLPTSGALLRDSEYRDPYALQSQVGFPCRSKEERRFFLTVCKGVPQQGKVDQAELAPCITHPRKPFGLQLFPEQFSLQLAGNLLLNEIPLLQQPKA